MQQTIDNRSWWQSARCPGLLRYHVRTTGRDILIVLAAYIGVSIVSLIFPFIFGQRYVSNGISGSDGWAGIVQLVMAITVAGSRTRFALRFGTPRLSVWLCNMISLFALVLGFQLATKLINILIALAVCGLSGAYPALFSFAAYYQDGLTGMALFNESLSELLKNIPMSALELLAWTGIFYLLGCCLRKHKLITLLIVIGIPALLMILMVVPAINQGVSAYQSGDQGVVMKMLLELYQLIVNVGRWVYDNYVLIEMLAGVACLPLSYLVMRTTKQP